MTRRAERRRYARRKALALALAGFAVMGLSFNAAEAGPIADATRAARFGSQGIAAQGLVDGEPDAGRAINPPPGIRADRDIAYGPDAAQRLDVYRPPGVGAAPIIVMVHGGAWMMGDKAASAVVTNKLTHWANQGMALVSINYRISTAPRVMDQVDDVARALAYVQEHAREWGGDPTRVLVMGHSAGAHLVSLLTSDPALAFAHGVRPWLATVALDSAALDVSQIMRARHYRFYDRVFGSDPAFWAATSPTLRLRAAPVAPMLMVCSSRRDESCLQAKAFAAKANDQGGKVTVLPVDLSHAQVNRDLGLTGDYTRAVDEFARIVGLRSD